MVREILDDTFALFALSGFRKGVARGTGSRPPAAGSAGIPPLADCRAGSHGREAIAAAPRRTLAAVDTVLPYHRAVRATGPEIIRSMRSGRVLRENPWRARHDSRWPSGAFCLHTSVFVSSGALLICPSIARWEPVSGPGRDWLGNAAGLLGRTGRG